MNTSQPGMDVFVCVHRRDVDYLLELVLRSYLVNFRPKAKLFLVTNDRPYLQDFVQRLEIDAILFSDEQWLSKQEAILPGWYKQQVIKLRAHEFCSTPNFCNLGADTVLLQPIEVNDLVQGGLPIAYYTSHKLPNSHFRYEQTRVENVGRIWKIEPVKARRYVDFINDLFCFNRETLVSLNADLVKLYGTEALYTLLKGLTNEKADQNKFGEWTLYSIYILDKLRQQVHIRNTRSGFLHQVHSRLRLQLFQFDSKVAHFVGKDFDANYIKQHIRKRGLALGDYLPA